MNLINHASMDASSTDGDFVPILEIRHLLTPD